MQGVIYRVNRDDAKIAEIEAKTKWFLATVDEMIEKLHNLRGSA